MLQDLRAPQRRIVMQPQSQPKQTIECWNAEVVYFPKMRVADNFYYCSVSLKYIHVNI